MNSQFKNAAHRSSLGIIAGSRIATSLLLTVLITIETPSGAAPRQKPESAADEVSIPESLDDAIRLVRERRAAMSGIADYIATFKKTEMVEGQVIDQSMLMKLRHKPFSVFLHYQTGKEKGREVLYVEGENDNQLLVREPGLLASFVGTVKLKIDDPQVREENRYPITEIGIGGILDQSIANWKSEQTADQENVRVRFLPDCKLDTIECEAVEVVRQQMGPKFPYSLTRVYFDKQSKLAIGAEQYGWPSAKGEEAPLLERYVYSDVKTNVGLTDADFDPVNPEYRFKAAAK